MLVKILLGILCTIGIILIAALLLCIILIFLKICVIIKYIDGNFLFTIQIGGFKKQIIPSKKSKKKITQKKSKTKKTGNNKSKKLPVPDYIDIARTIINKLLTRAYYKRFYLDFRIAENDASKTAMLYGKLNAIIYPLAALIYNNKKVKDMSIHIQPDFLSEKSIYNIDILLYTRGAYLLGGLISIAKYLI